MCEIYNAVNALNDLYQRRHISKPQYEFIFNENVNTVTCYCTVQENNSAIITRAQAVTLQAAKNASAVFVCDQLNISVEVCSKIKLHRLEPNYQEWYLLCNYCFNNELSKPQIYRCETDDRFHVCIPELNLRGTDHFVNFACAQLLSIIDNLNSTIPIRQRPGRKILDMYRPRLYSRSVRFCDDKDHCLEK